MEPNTNLYIPVNIKTRFEFFEGYGVTELIPTVIAALVSGFIAFIVHSMAEGMIIPVLIVLITIAGSVMSLAKGENNMSVMPGDEIRYDMRELKNTSTVQLTDFYWRDSIPTDAIRLTKIVTGTFNQGLKYKVIATTSSGETKVVADNLSTTQNNVIDFSNASLGLKNDEYVTSFTFAFGTVKPGFNIVEAPQVYARVLNGLQNGYQFANKTDVGGMYGSEWIVGNSTWLTTIYSAGKLPKTGY